jgi:hypothetical protein
MPTLPPYLRLPLLQQHARSGFSFYRGREEAVHSRIHVSLSLNTIESLFDLAKYRFWSGEAIPGVRRPVFIRVRTAYSITAT